MSETNNFIIHKHNTTHPHYDFYLQIGEDLKSWIVPKGIPENTGEKKIAVECRSNEQPLSKSAPKKSIEDSYGTGPVEIWDEGTFEVETNKNIKIIIQPDGNKFKGKYIFHVPNWGRWTKNKLWTIEKIR